MSEPETRTPESTVEPIEPDAHSLVSQLRVIEDQPLEDRAAAFAQVHDRLQRRLEGGDSTAQNG